MEVLLNARDVENLRALIAYNWDDELADAREHGAAGHIFGALVALDNAVERRTCTVDDYLIDSRQEG